MTDVFLKSAQSLLQDPSLQIFAEESWGSQNSEHRTLMHAKVDKLKALNPNAYISISHCQGMGIIAASINPIGVDIELSERVADKVIARVSSEQELALAPSPASLWCAKEACFKALKTFKQPSVLSQISIGAWRNIDSQTETCLLTNPQSFYSPSENQGIVFQFPQHTSAIFIFRT